MRLRLQPCLQAALPARCIWQSAIHAQAPGRLAAGKHMSSCAARACPQLRTWVAHWLLQMYTVSRMLVL